MQVKVAAKKLEAYKAGLKKFSDVQRAAAGVADQLQVLSAAHAAAIKDRERAVSDVKSSIQADGEGVPSLNKPSLYLRYDYINTAEALQSCGVISKHLRDATTELEHDALVADLEDLDAKLQAAEKCDQVAKDRLVAAGKARRQGGASADAWQATRRREVRVLTAHRK